MYHLVDNGDGSGVQHWEGVNDPEYGLLPQNLDVGISDSYVAPEAYEAGQKETPMPFQSGNHSQPGGTTNVRATGYVPLPGEDANHTAGN